MGLPTQDLKEPIYFYNYKRIHSVIGYITPAQKMAELKKVAWNVSKLTGPLQSTTVNPVVNPNILIASVYIRYTVKINILWDIPVTRCEYKVVMEGEFAY